MEIYPEELPASRGDASGVKENPTVSAITLRRDQNLGITKKIARCGPEEKTDIE